MFDGKLHKPRDFECNENPELNLTDSEANEGLGLALRLHLAKLLAKQGQSALGNGVIARRALRDEEVVHNGYHRRIAAVFAPEAQHGRYGFAWLPADAA